MRAAIAQLYDRIKATPFRMDEDDMFESEVSTFVAPLRSGVLLKRGSALGSYKRYWFVLTGFSNPYPLPDPNPSPYLGLGSSSRKVNCTGFSNPYPLPDPDPSPYLGPRFVLTEGQLHWFF